MTRSNSPPSLRRHKPSRQGVVTLSGRDHYLGHWPEGDKKPPAEVRRRYDALVAEWLANGRRPAIEGPAPFSVAELILAFRERRASVHYRYPDGTPTSELGNFDLSLRQLGHLYGTLPAADFSPLRLKAVRDVMIAEGLSRGVINQRVGRITRMFKWAVAEELVPGALYEALLAVEGLKAGPSRARECEPVRPVPDRDLEAVLPLLSRPLRGLLRVQRLAAMRPGEAAQMKGSDIDTSGPVWLYRPPGTRWPIGKRSGSSRSAPSARPCSASS